MARGDGVCRSGHFGMWETALQAIGDSIAYFLGFGWVSLARVWHAGFALAISERVTLACGTFEVAVPTAGQFYHFTSRSWASLQLATLSFIF